MNGIIGFDLEIARPFPEDGWNRESSLGISCAATYSLDPNDIRVYHPLSLIHISEPTRPY